MGQIMVDEMTHLLLHLPLHPFCFPPDLRGCHLCQLGVLSLLAPSTRLCELI